MNGMLGTQFDLARLDFPSPVTDHACFDYLSCETFAKDNDGAKAF